MDRKDPGTLFPAESQIHTFTGGGIFSSLLPLYISPHPPLSRLYGGQPWIPTTSGWQMSGARGPIQTHPNGSVYKTVAALGKEPNFGA